MGADRVIVCFGVRYTFEDVNAAILGELADETHPLIVAALQAGLDAWFGSPDCDETHYLFIGSLLARMSAETLGETYTEYVALTQNETQNIMKETRDKLKIAEIQSEPVLHIQLEIGC